MNDHEKKLQNNGEKSAFEWIGVGAFPSLSNEHDDCTFDLFSEVTKLHDLNGRNPIRKKTKNCNCLRSATQWSQVGEFLLTRRAWNWELRFSSCQSHSHFLYLPCKDGFLIASTSLRYSFRLHFQKFLLPSKAG